MQVKSAEKCSISKRLETLRLAKQLTWDGMADLLEISPSMIYQVKRGARCLGDLVLHRLEQAEIDAGLLSRQDAAWNSLMRNPTLAAISDASPSEIENVTTKPTAHDNYTQMRLEVLADIIDTYDSAQIDSLYRQLKNLVSSDKTFGKVFDQVAQLVAHLQILKQQKEEAETPRKTRQQGKSPRSR